MKIVEDVHFPFEVTSDIVDELVKTSTPILDETHVHEENISDVQDVLVESSTPQCFKYRILAIYRSAKLCTGYQIPGDISRYDIKYRLIYQK